jgi:signal transduction histidine kinase
MLRESVLPERTTRAGPRSVTSWIRRAINSLPRGGSLPEETWRTRHRVIVAILWAHAVGLPLFALARGYTFRHGLLDDAPVVAFALLASARGRGRKFRSAASALGLLSSSAVLVHLSGGTIEAHFHFFVVIGMLTMYEDWLPFLIAIGYTAIHHGLMGVIAPRSVYNHPAAWAHPWTWAGIHAGFVLAASVVLLVAWRMNEDIRARLTDSLSELRRTDDERRSLLERVVHAREDEDRRIAVELHDGPVQRLTQLDYLAERIRLRLEGGHAESGNELLVQVQDGLRTEIAELRRMMSELRPAGLAERGLSAAVRDHGEQVERSFGIRCTFRSDLAGRLAPALEEALYRITQEALTNVGKHARATEASVTLQEVDGRVVLRVVDDGRGFDTGRTIQGAGGDHFGLISIRERVLMEGGEFAVRSAPGQGTEVRVSFPSEAALDGGPDLRQQAAAEVMA